MLDHPEQAGPSSPQSSEQRFLGSVSGVLNELQKFLLSSAQPIEPNTGAQIAQMLRAIREVASARSLDGIAHTTADIETYLISADPYRPDGALRNVVLHSKIEELLERVADASDARKAPVH